MTKDAPEDPKRLRRSLAVWLIQEMENVIQGRYGESSITSRAVILFMVSCWENHKSVMVKMSEDSKS